MACQIPRLQPRREPLGYHQAESQQEGEGRYLFGGIPAHFAEGLGQPGSTSHTNFDQRAVFLEMLKMT